MERIEDGFGSLEVAQSSVERERSDEFPDEGPDVVDKVHLSDIDSVEIQPESEPPALVFDVAGERLRMPFSDAEAARRALGAVKYQLNVFSENLG